VLLVFFQLIVRLPAKTVGSCLVLQRSSLRIYR